MPKSRHLVTVFILFALSVMGALVRADIMTTDKISDVRGTKHNLSADADLSATPKGGTVPKRAVKASSETQVCVFCHTPHSATIAPNAPLWNRSLSAATSYTPYYSDSIDAYDSDHKPQPGGSSKLCLSCHDGTMAIDKVNVLSGAANATISMTSSSLPAGQNLTSPVTMPTGDGASTGFTRDLGTDLSNDHPISFTFNSTVAINDGELTAPGVYKGADGTKIVGTRIAGGARPKLPLEAPSGVTAPDDTNGQIQCATCHDPHIRDKNEASNGNAKFLRLNRFQVAQHSTGTSGFDSGNDIICLACHNKGGDAWAYSAHGNSNVSNQTYTQAAANKREFPTFTSGTTTTGPKVWQVACLNCHDTHTVAGARRLLREGADSKGAALEQVCYSCHASSKVTSAVNGTVPDVGKDFMGTGTHMPIATSEQATITAETHNIAGTFNDTTNALTTNNDKTGNNCSNRAGQQTGNCGKDLLEARTNLGLGNLYNRHVECSDCHNPHRVVKFQDFRGDATNHSITTTTPDSSGTHPHADNTTLIHTNIASGVLRGSWGVEPQWPVTNTDSFHTMPSGFDVKKGDPGTSSTTSTAVTASYVTREYQICLKCHSNYAFADDNKYPSGIDGNRPKLGSPGTAAGTNGLNKYTNVAKEIHAPTAHQGEPKNLGGLAGADGTITATTDWVNYNHRSWHPVMDKTLRTLSSRGIDTTSASSNPWLVPWRNAVGNNTMYCSDCHGSSTGTSTVIPNTGNAWGPHGSSNNFILKGVWDGQTGGTGQSNSYTVNALCFKCHDPDKYANGNTNGGGTKTSGFSGSVSGNLHQYHANKIQRMHCTWCHIAVPHGWKNKAFLVNLNDVGAEAGQSSSKEVIIRMQQGDCCGPTKGTPDYYSQEPYYLNAKLKILKFAASGSWEVGNCGSANKATAALIPGLYTSLGITTQVTTGNDTNTGKTWMQDTCNNPP